jgi:hypothetical protein
MGQVVQFLRPEKAFDSEVVTIVAAAYEKAIAGIGNQAPPEIVRHIAARRILALASKGERDPDRLRAAGVVKIGSS